MNHHAPVLNRAEFRFYEELNDFLPPARRKRAFSHDFRGTPSVRDTIQALGVPHTAVDLILVDGEPVDFTYRLRGGERVAVYPVFERLDISPIVRLRPSPLRRTRFVLDVHLGRLARYLRMLGFDAAWGRGSTDPEIIDQAADEHRIILTRDLGILKHGRVTHGYWVRSAEPEEQISEVLKAFHLGGQAAPFTRCMECNGILVPADPGHLRKTVGANIRKRFQTFRQCAECGKVYWKGSHYQRMLERVERLNVGGE